MDYKAKEILFRKKLLPGVNYENVTANDIKQAAIRIKSNPQSPFTSCDLD